MDNMIDAKEMKLNLFFVLWKMFDGKYTEGIGNKSGMSDIFYSSFV